MANIRLIPRLDVKGANLIKGIQLEGVRVIGDPIERALAYYEAGADEILYMDAVASLYQRNSLHDIIRDTARGVFVPITVGGGIRSVEDAQKVLLAGADKVAVNTAAIEDPGLITRISKRFGSQAMVLSIEAKRVGEGKWEAYTNCGRERSHRDVLQWAVEVVERGAGEILLTSIDQEGTRKGFDFELTKAISSTLSTPIIASGGMGCVEDLVNVVSECGASAVAMADILHYERKSLPCIRAAAKNAGVSVRTI